MHKWRKEVTTWHTDLAEDLVVEEGLASVSEGAPRHGPTLVEAEVDFPGAGIPA